MSSTKVISFSSGKGGVGKTFITANLGHLWANAGRKTLIIDGDWNLGKQAILLGVRPKVTIDKVLRGEITLRDSVQWVSENLFLLASPSGLLDFETLDEKTRNALFYQLEDLIPDFDLVLFDHSSGVHPEVLQFAAASHQQVIITTTEPTSYTDAYAIMKLLSNKYRVREFKLLVNMVQPSITTDSMDRFCDVVRHHLDVRINQVGSLPWEQKVSGSIQSQSAFVRSFPGHSITQKLQRICLELERVERSQNHGLQFFYHQLDKLAAGEL
jgi:flagellar biosynthesis protein FlhG